MAKMDWDKKRGLASAPSGTWITPAERKRRALKKIKILREELEAKQKAQSKRR